MRLIDADALRRWMYHGAFEVDSGMQKWDSGLWIRYKMFENGIESAPTIDAVPVVRCKDCQWCQYDEVYGQRWCGGGRVEPDGYCSYGKRKDLSLGTDNSEPRVELEPITGEYNRYHGELDVRNGKLTIYGSDRCVCCGAIVPEGTQVCPTCIRKAES